MADLSGHRGDGTGTAAAPADTAPGPASGPRRVLVTIYAVFALAATARAVVQISTTFASAPVAYLLSLLSGLVYIGATAGLVSHRSWSRPLAWISCSVELVGVLVVGALSIADSAAFPRATVWSHFGAGYGYVPVILPMLGLWFLWRTRPSSPAAR